ncbi:type II toxin-antitoxin system ParD family antitoxin [Candidatus Gottesmanbacteria bacterium]|nr:type II toxin-antitoxin system ParD family antitoxin [Candidatus Gottesmanbacteria bacterium]
MSTINVSLPAEQISFIDTLVGQYGFANRSEFIRSLVRLIKQQPTIVSRAAVFPFETPKTTSISTIMADFKKTKKYSLSFLKDLNEGLSQSTYFYK